MDRRTLLAVLLTAIVIVLTPILFPTTRPQPPRVDSAQSATPSAGTTTVAAAPRGNVAAAPRPGVGTVGAARVGPAAHPETTVVRTNRAVYTLASPGAAPVRVQLSDYRSLAPGATHDSRITLVDSSEHLLALRLVRGRDTVALDTIAFRAVAPPRRAGSDIIVALSSLAPTVPLTLEYTFPVDSFAFAVRGTLASTPDRPASLVISLPARIRSQEADTVDDRRHLAFGLKRSGRDVQSITFRDLDSGVTRVDTSGLRWVAERNKYFVVAAIATAPDSLFASAYFRGGQRVGKEALTAHAAVVVPVARSEFRFRVYAGPQSWADLRHAAPDLENVNPYGGWIPHSVVQPFTTLVVRLLLWMRRTFHVEYGWVLILLGVFIRLLLWPLSQKSMRASMQMQRLQPEMTEIQKRFRNDPQRQQEAIMKLYREHGMSPLSPLLGCLPMLLPMPILLALYFVFANTIELRGVSFLWLPDLSLRDPYFITPIFMGASMFLMSWIGMRNAPPSPQGKMMSYMMPVMFTALFWNLASGLNLYYAVQNMAALPQQWLLARERAKQPQAVRPKGTSRDGS